MEQERPLCVDLDGTLVHTDTLIEGFLSLFRSGWRGLLVPFWLLRGKAHLKRRVAGLASLNVAWLPYNREFLQEVRTQRERGRAVFLTTGADERLASRVAEHLGCFDGVIASDGAVNLTGHAKRKALEFRFGVRGFDYAGDSVDDLPVWQSASGSIFVTPSRGVLRKARSLGVTPTAVYHGAAKPSLPLLLRALRLHQWAKNALLFVPLLLAHQILSRLPQAALAFLAFGTAASAIYVVNDLLDLEADRQHPTKKSRPFASGDLPLHAAAAVVPTLLVVSAGLATLLPPAFGVVLGAYVLATLLYSLFLKRIVLVDILVLAGLYTVRIIAGGVATAIPISPWTLAFAVFWFLSLAALKRFSELKRISATSGAVAPGRSYQATDMEQMAILGAAAGYMSIVVMALYISSADVQRLYSRSDWLWFALPFLLYWISRMWVLAGRGAVHEDPVLYAIKDRATYVVGAGVLLIALLSL